MSKLATVALLAALAIAQGFPAPSGFGDESAIAEAASKGDWDLVHKLIKEKFNDSTLWQPDFSNASVRSLQPVRGGHVYGESEVAYSSSSNINGKKTENSGGHRIINNDGKIDEFDFKPAFPQKPSIF